MALASVALSLPSRAAAQGRPPRAVQRIFDEGVELAEAGDWAAALTRFEEADRRYAHPSIRLNLAAAQAETGHFRSSIATYESLLRDLEAGTFRSRSVDSATVEQALTQVRGRVPRLRIVVEPSEPSDELRLDGSPIDAEEAAHGLELDPGTYVASWWRDGEERGTQTVRLAERRSETVRFSAVATAEGGGERDEGTEETSGGGSDGSALTIAGAVLIGVGVASLAVSFASMGVIDGYSNDETLLDYRGRIPPGTMACPEAEGGRGYGLSGGDLDHVLSVCGDASTFEALQYVFLATGLVAATGGAVLLAIGLGSSSSDQPTATLRPRFGRTYNGLELRGTF